MKLSRKKSTGRRRRKLQRKKNISARSITKTWNMPKLRPRKKRTSGSSCSSMESLEPLLKPESLLVQCPQSPRQYSDFEYEEALETLSSPQGKVILEDILKASMDEAGVGSKTP